MDRLVNEIGGLYSLSTRKLRRNKETIAIELTQYGILLTSDDSLINSKMHCISVNPKKLDDRIYCNSILQQVFWALIESGYMHELRNDKPGFFKNLLFDHGWANKIVAKRLEKWGDAPKYKNLVRINKEYMDNLAISFQRKPWFFDFLWV
jgi:hypothetical protein